MKTIEKIIKRGLRVIPDLVMDMRYGGFVGLRGIPARYPGAYGVSSTDYGIMAQMFDNWIKESDVLVDVGCGPGRVIKWWLSRGFRNQIIGIELMEDVAEKTRRQLRKFKNVKIISGDATRDIPAEGTAFYLFNPFDAGHVEAFKDRLFEQFGEASDIRILYYACVHVDVFKSDPRWVVEEFEVKLPRLFGYFEERHRRVAVITINKTSTARFADLKDQHASSTH